MPYNLKTFSIILFLFLSVNYSGLAQDETTPGRDTTAPALKTVHSEQLREIMLRLNELAYEREYTELGLDSLRARQIEALAKETSILVSNAERLTDILSEGELNESDQITFMAVANQLNAEVQNIQADVNANRFGNLHAGYRRLQQTCNACHRLFRSDN